MDGWVKFHRKAYDNFLYTENRPHTRREAWEDLIALANHEDSECLFGNEKIECKRGQSIRSLETWAKLFNWDKSKVKRFLDLLRKEKMIVTEDLRKTTRITICNYEYYQGDRNTDETQMKRKRNADKTPATPNKNDKKEKNTIYIPDFDEFKNYALETDPLIDVFSLEIKYKAWKENGWKNGKEKEIKNWKSALLNTLPYIKHNTTPLPQPQQSTPKRGLVENPNFDPR